MTQEQIKTVEELLSDFERVASLVPNEIDLGKAYRAAKDMINEAKIEESITPIPDSSILANTGHSYSGISNVVYSEPYKTPELIKQVDDRYNELIAQQSELEEAIEQVKSNRGTLVSDFFYLHRALKLDDKSLSFVNAGNFVEIKILSEENHRINYERYPITVDIDK